MYASPNVSLASALLLANLLVFPCRGDEKTVPAPVNDPQFHPVLLSVARYYEIYGRVDNSSRWAPWSCNAHAGNVHLSRSEDAKSHGGKLYYLYVKHAKDYLQTSERDFQPRPSGLIDKDALQVVVKETWEARRTDDPPGEFNGFGPSNPKAVDTSKSAERDGVYYVPSKRSDLFIMIQFEKERPGTDEGWVYGTVSPDGKQVTSSGRVQNCMNCHLSAPRHRLFGLGYSSPKPKDAAAP